MKRQFVMLSKAEQEEVESEYHRKKAEEFDETMARAKAQRVHEKLLSQRENADNALAQMAADPEIERELRAIEGEFSPAESDGLKIT
jgi:hypothetical protein